MGYSGRYHAASLAAVFLALAIGILIGVGLGSDVVSGTAEDLEKSLGSDLDEARAQIEELEAAIARERDFAEDLAPAVLAGRLAGADVALIGLGGLDEALVADVRAALEPAGAALAAVGVVSEPPNSAAIAAAIRSGERSIPRGAALERGARRAGRGLVRADEAFDALRGALFSRFSGEPGGIDAVVVAQAAAAELEPRAQEDTERVEEGLLEGIAEARGGANRVIVAGAERSDAEPSAIGFFREHGLPSVDNVDQLSGRVSLVFVLDGAEGSYGTKETAEALLPDLLRRRPEGVGPGS